MRPATYIPVERGFLGIRGVCQGAGSVTPKSKLNDHPLVFTGGNMEGDLEVVH